MTKEELADYVRSRLDLPKGEIQQVIDAIVLGIKTSMAEGKNVYIRGFGTFSVKKRKAKMARDINKEEAVIVPEHFAPAFKPAVAFRTMIKISKKIDNGRK